MQKHDGDGFRARIDQPAELSPKVGDIERRLHGAVRADSLAHFRPQRTLAERGRQLKKHVVQIVAELAPDLQHVTEAMRRQKTRPCPGALDQRVGDEGRRMQAMRHRLGRYGVPPQQPPDALQDRGGRITGGRQDFADQQPA
jgi:hypothetical protein